MNKLIAKLGTSVATAALLSSAFATAALADNAITNNGADSYNKITIYNNCTTDVWQSNKTYVAASANASASTGGNEASYNTAADVSIATGSATASATVNVSGSTNTATAPNCCECVNPESANTIDGNGAGSTNKVKENTNTLNIVTQKNKGATKARAGAKAKTGKNTASSNTIGTVGITTGNANATSSTTVTGPSNTLNP